MKNWSWLQIGPRKTATVILTIKQSNLLAWYNHSYWYLINTMWQLNFLITSRMVLLIFFSCCRILILLFCGLGQSPKSCTQPCLLSKTVSWCQPFSRSQLPQPWVKFPKPHFLAHPINYGTLWINPVPICELCQRVLGLFLLDSPKTVLELYLIIWRNKKV